MFKSRSKANWLVGIMFMLIGFSGMKFIAGPVSDTFSQKGNWMQTEGEVTNAEVISFRSNGQTMYRASLVYKYLVNDKEYRSDQIQAALSSTSFRYFPEKKVKNHPVGSAIQVFYNPDDPSEALLEPGLGILKYVLYAIPASFLLFGFIVFWRGAIRPIIALVILSKSKI